MLASTSKTPDTPKPVVTKTPKVKSKKARKIAPDAVTCAICELEIREQGKTTFGDTQPYKAASLITHFKQAHGLKANDVDSFLGVPFGTTPKISPSLAKRFQESGAAGANALRQQAIEDEDEAIKAGF